ncbi:microcystin degradation protein MlrC [Sinorhizobium terangae]|uniref:Microcystin LR degradation protein MlrC N-terminal domain-containing protein n=1 Tax=Sinorhizobium terangae TaxID=110322 RepID=A0A6N7LJG1_SINTE|nr:M81 family metallopeptidase [Sinorhizobium terangae]MBB4189757.1 microcystin degradation protein MlrC [Sinorhizobium terangae]MQX17932.1 hypothetical protein [Sinorhizobium terangae]
MRILIAQRSQETHSFNPLKTCADDFVVERGQEVLAANRQRGTALGGIIRAAEERGIELMPSIAARARPGGPVESQIYDQFKRTLLEDIKRLQPDAICLDLHGSVATELIEDCEGDLLSAIRYPRSLWSFAAWGRT